MRTEAKASPRRQAALRTISCGRDIAALVNALMPVVLEGLVSRQGPGDPNSRNRVEKRMGIGPKSDCGGGAWRENAFPIIALTGANELRVQSQPWRRSFMKLRHLALIGTFILVGSAQAGEDQAVARACKADAQHMCAGKTGQDLQQCLKGNQEKLSANCKEAVSKLPPKS
jgi:hypothetical protein